MPVNTDFQIPFLPQTGITQQVLTAIQLANEHNIARQRLALQQQAQPSEIALRTAQTGQTEAETAAIPQRLALTKEEIEANKALREAQINAEATFHKGMLGLGEAKLNEQATNNAAKIELARTRDAWEARKAAVGEQTAVGSLQLRREALANLKQYQGAEVTLREQANQLHEQGNETAAQAMITRADQVANQTGFWRTALGEIGLVTPVQIPPASQTKGAAPAAPAKPKGLPPGAVPGTLNGKHGYSLNGKFVED